MARVVSSQFDTCPSGLEQRSQQPCNICGVFSIEAFSSIGEEILGLVEVPSSRSRRADSWREDTICEATAPCW